MWGPLLPLQSSERAEEKIAEVVEVADCLSTAIHGNARVLVSSWGVQWLSYWGGTHQWAEKSRDDLDDFGTNSQDTPRIINEGNARLVRLRQWYREAEEEGVAHRCPTPRDMVSFGPLGEVPRWAVYVGAGVGAIGLTLLVSREARAWATAAGVDMSPPPRRKRR